MVVLLTLRLKCSLFAPKPAHSSSKLPLASRCASRGDDTDYGVFSHGRKSACWSQKQETDLPPKGASLGYQTALGDQITEEHDEDGTRDQRVDYDISVINRNHRNHSDLHASQTTFRAERHQSDNAPDTNNTYPGKARASPVVQDKMRCPHHPHARWIRYDPSGQAWCDKMDCWDSYRLMKIGEVLDYRSLWQYSRGIVTVEQGIEAWSSFVTFQGSFAVLTATQYAIDFCKALGLRFPISQVNCSDWWLPRNEKMPANG